MKLRKQAPAKAVIVAVTTGLLFAFYGLIKSEPRIKAEAGPEQQQPPVDYQRFFAPGASTGDAADQTAPLNPHIRTRAS